MDRSTIGNLPNSVDEIVLYQCEQINICVNIFFTSYIKHGKLNRQTSKLKFLLTIKLTEDSQRKTNKLCTNIPI